MADNKHTPGPWQVKRAEVRTDGEYDYAIYDANKQVIAEAFGRSSHATFPPAEANAHLIAASPDMKDVMDTAPILSMYHGANGFEVERFIAHYNAWTDRRITAIAKAEGR